MMPARIFICSVGEDEEHQQQLRELFSPYTKNGLMQCYSAKDLRLGAPSIEDAIQEQLNDAAVVIVLLSARFLASDSWIRALERFSHSRRADVIIVPVLLSSCIWESIPYLSKIKPNFQKRSLLRMEGEDRLNALRRIVLAVHEYLQEKERPLTGYEYDFFISYCRVGPAADWMHMYFEPLVKKWIPGILNSQVVVYVDYGIDYYSPAGEYVLSQILGRQLHRSRCLLSVWSPDYFSCRFCRAELASTLSRGDGAAGAKLVYPVLFSDGDNIPAHLRQHRLGDLKQPVDLRPYNSTTPGYEFTTGYCELEQAVQRMLAELESVFFAAPEWSPSWRYEMIADESSQLPHISLRRFG